MKISEILDRAKNPLVSFEIIPPTRGKTVQEVIDIVETLAPHNPAWIDVTSHPAGVVYKENEDGTIQKEFSENVLAHSEFVELLKTDSILIPVPTYYATASLKKKQKTP